MAPVRLVALALVVLWFTVVGMSGLALLDVETRQVPPKVPSPRPLLQVTGLLELLSAVGLGWRPARRAAGWLLFALTLFAMPLYPYALQRPELSGLPHWVLVARLSMQALLLVPIAWSTAPVGCRRSYRRV